MFCKNCGNEINRYAKIIAILLVTVLMCSSILGCECNNKKELHENKSGRDYNYDYNEFKMQDLLYVETQEIRKKLAFTDLDITPGKINNTVEDYKEAITGLDETDLIGFYLLVQYDEIETEKFIVALGYENWDDFLIKNNHIDREGEPSMGIWLNDEYQRLYDEYVEYEKELER